jgi:hypothetical protein
MVGKMSHFGNRYLTENKGNKKRGTQKGRIAGGKENKKLTEINDKTIRILKKLRNKTTIIRKIRLRRPRTNKKCDKGRQAEVGELGTRKSVMESKAEE